MIILSQRRLSISALSVILALSLILNIHYQSPILPEGWKSLDTTLPLIKYDHDEYYQNQLLITKVNDLIDSSDTRLILLPELVITEWNQATRFLWRNTAAQAERNNIIILIGSKKRISSNHYITGLQTMGATNSQFLLDRVPVPISMWRPWTTQPSAQRFWLNNGVYKIHNQKVATLICYEQLLVWPILLSMLYQPDVILASSNVWWAKGTNIPHIQDISVKAWARLCAVPVLQAVNR